MSSAPAYDNVDGRAHHDEEEDHHENIRVTNKVAYWFTIASANGFNRLVEAKFKIRLFWMFVIFVCYMCMVVHLSYNFKEYFSYGADTNIDFQTEKVEIPDITICRIGLPKEVHDADVKIGIAEFAYKVAYPQLSGFDKMRLRSNYFARANFYRNPKLSQEHIGQYLMVCNYLGDDCDFRNFTLYRDPVFTNCFTFTPRSRQLSNSGKFLTLGLYTEPESVKHDADYLVVLHDTGTRPDILHGHVLVPVGGITEITLKIDKIELLSRPFARCRENETVDYLYTQRPSTKFKYTKVDCFWKELHNKIMKRCKCSPPTAGVRPEWRNQTECFTLPHFSSHELQFINYYKLKMDAEFGKINQSQVPNITESLKGHKRAVMKKLKTIQLELDCYMAWYKNLASGYSDSNCEEACVTKQITAWRVYNFYRQEEIILMQEFLMPNKTVRARTKTMLENRGLFNNMSRNMLDFANTLRDAYWEAGKKTLSKEDEARLRHQVLTKVAMLTLNIQKVPGDRIYETRSYPLFSLLSDIGGNSGLWAGFSVISLFEFFELALMVIGSHRKKRRVLKKYSVKNGKTEMEPVAAEIPMLYVSTAEKENEKS